MKKGLAAIWIVLITVVVMAGLGGGGWYYLDGKQKAEKKDFDNQITQLQSQVKELKDAAEAAVQASDDTAAAAMDDTTTPVVDPYLYTNSVYHFSLQFNSLWQGYQMKEATIAGSTKTYYVCVPTTDAFYQAASSTSLAGTVSILALSVYSQAQWTAATAEEGPTPTKVGQSGNWIIGYSPAQAYPADKAPLASNVKTVLATFAAL